MPPLPNLKHERFAQALFRGKPQLEAYTEAGYKPSEQHACRLASDGKVKARLTELQGRLAEKTITTVESLVKELEETRTDAQGDKQHSAAVSAVLGKAKLLGLIIDRREQGDPGAFDNMTEDQLRDRLREKLGNVVKLRVNEK